MKNNDIKRGIYIHIPLCDYMCPYCNYNAEMINNKKYVNKYVDCIIKEIENLKIDGNINTIYIGGGSPNFISDLSMEDLLAVICNKIDILKLDEYTIEAKPNELEKKRIHILKKYGINRVSMPIQTLKASDKECLGLKYSKIDVESAINNLYNEGISNISTDLLLLNYKRSTIESILDEIESYKINHVTCYSLDEFLNNDMTNEIEYEYIIGLLKNRGYSQYDLINFSKNYSKGIHNSNYWKRGEYYAVGAGAHGFINGCRYSNYSDIKEYIYRVENGMTSIETVKNLSFKERIEEEFFLGLQLLEGINIEELNSKYLLNTLDIYRSIINKHINFGNLKLNKKILKLTNKGLLNSSEVLSDFLIDEI